MLYMISVQVPVFHVHMTELFFQMAAQPFRHKDRPVHASGAADGNGELGFPRFLKWSTMKSMKSYSFSKNSRVTGAFSI